jgi:TonB family protein
MHADSNHEELIHGSHVMKKLLCFGLGYWRASLALFLVIAIAQPAFAFDDPPGRIARLNYVQGDVSFLMGGEQEWVWASVNRPLTTGDSLWADSGSRAEMRIGSTAIRIDENTAVSFLNLDDRTVQVQLNSGSLNVRVRNFHDADVFEIDTPNVAVSLLQPGDYRIDVDPGGGFTSVTVRDGECEINGGGQAFLVDAGSQAQVSGTDDLTYNIYDPPPPDEFDQWSFARDRRFGRSPSARYVSPELTGYEDLDENGDWIIDPHYGPVWIPNQVSEDWAPYREGHWVWVDPWGWSWVDDSPWGFATSHYGRWAYLRFANGRGVWAWVPPRQERYPRSYDRGPVYSPANVVFLGDPRSFGGGAGVAWFPLAPGEVYVPAYQTSTTYITNLNVTNTQVQTTYITTIVNNPPPRVSYANQRVAGAVIAVPSAVFVSAAPVARATVKVSANVVAAAPVVRAAPIAPVRASVLGGNKTKAAAAAPPPKPPVAVVSRPVVAKVTPPPPPVPFAQKQQAMAANPGKPLDPKTVQSLRPAAPPEKHVVKTAPLATPVKAAASLPKKPQPANPPDRPRPGQPSTQVVTPPKTPPTSQQAQQQAQRTREQQAAEEQAKRAREQQAAEEQAKRTREQQAAEEQAKKTREKQMAQSRPPSGPEGRQANPPSKNERAPANTQPLHVAENVQAGKLIFQPPLQYPPDAKKAKVQGTVHLQVLIGSDGIVKNVTVLNGPPMLQGAAVENANQRRYKPTLLNGEPMEVLTEISVDFRLPK